MRILIGFTIGVLIGALVERHQTLECTDHLRAITKLSEEQIKLVCRRN